MERKQTFRLARGITLLLAGIIITAEYTRQLISAPPAINAKTNPIKNSTRQVAATVLADQIAKIEVEKLLESVKFAQTSPELVSLQKQQAQLEQRLAQMQLQDNQVLVEHATTRALESEIADLDTKYAKNQVKLTKSHPLLQVQASQLSALRQRLSALQ